MPVSWALKPETLHALDERLTQLQPRLIVEAGSGQSTAVLNYHAPTISLEHEPFYHRLTKQLVPTADVRLAPLVEFPTPEGLFPWYDAELPNGIDFALIDGPPSKYGRQAALFALWPHLSLSAEVWLDDYQRQGEQDCLRLWHKHLDFYETPVNQWALRLERAS